MARTYKRDSRGRFAGGGGSSGGRKAGGGQKRNKSRVTTTGTFLTRGKAKIAQRERTKAFSSKATVGRSAREAYKAAARGARVSEKHAKSTANAIKQSAQAPTRATQKERWAKRAELRRQQADRADARAQETYSRHRRFGDNAFWTQPGLTRQRDKARAGIDRAFRDMQKAERLRQRAANLERLATTNKGDAERARQVKRDAFSGSKGDRVSTPLYGAGRIVRVNKKTVSYYSEQTGTVVKVDKSWVRPG